MGSAMQQGSSSTAVARIRKRRTVEAFTEFLTFGCLQANASLFGGLLLGAIVWTDVFPPQGFYRYDVLFFLAVTIQAVLLASGLESSREAMVIFGFHAVATLMEIFKTSDLIGSWNYPGQATFALYGVPLFAGFMYSAVGSYLARAWRLLSLEFEHYPRLMHTLVLAAFIYGNFFSHHFMPDLRYALLAVTFFLYRRTTVHFTVVHRRSMPLLVGFALIAVFIWIAENMATFAGVWVYPSQRSAWTLVSPNKLVAWFLLMIVSFVLVSLLHRRKLAEMSHCR